MKRALRRLYYLIETFFIRGTHFQLLAVAAVIALVSLCGGVVVHLFTGQFPDLGVAIWWAFLRLTDPGYLGDDTGTLTRVVSTTLTVAGYVLFLGALVAIMTTWLSRFMSYLASGRSSIFERDHFLIIGWSPRIHAIIEEIVHARERVNRRLGRRRLPAIAVLTGEFRPALVHELRQKLDPEVRKACRLLVRSGDPLEAESLERVDFARASAIILVAQQESMNPASRQLSDIGLVKVLMSMTALLEEVDHDEEGLPSVVVEICNPANKMLAESVGWSRRTEAIVSDDFIARLLCQSIRYPGLSGVYDHLLTDTFGESIYLMRVDDLEGLAGMRLGQAVRRFEEAIPIGVLKARVEARGHVMEQRLRLLQLDEVLEPDDELICLSPSIRSISDSLVDDRQLEASEAVGGLSAPSTPRSLRERRILILGWSHIMPALLEELSSYEASGERYLVQIVGGLEPREATAQLGALSPRLANVEVQYRRARVGRMAEVRELEPEGFDSIVFLGSELYDDPKVADAETIMTHVLIARYLQEVGASDVHLVAEVHDEDNRRLFALERHVDMLMTEEISSHILSQVAVRRALAWIYERLFTQGGPEIQLAPLASVIDLAPEQRVNFDQIQRTCLGRGRVALGFRLERSRGDALARGIHLNPPRGLAFLPEPGDQVVLLDSEGAEG